LLETLHNETKELREAITSIAGTEIKELKDELETASDDFTRLREAIATEANRGAEHFKCSADANGNRPKCNAELCCGRAKKDNSIGITMSVDVCFKRTAQSYGVKNADGQIELWTFACIDCATKITAAAFGALSLSYMLA